MPLRDKTDEEKAAIRAQRQARRLSEEAKKKLITVGVLGTLAAATWYFFG